jgi:hypothetical protein
MIQRDSRQNSLSLAKPGLCGREGRLQAALAARPQISTKVDAEGAAPCSIIILNWQAKPKAHAVTVSNCALAGMRILRH